MAYAIENNSTKTAKLLLDSGVKVDDIKAIQRYIIPPLYSLIDKLIISGDDIKIIYEDGYKKDIESKDAIHPMNYVVSRNYIKLTQMILESGYIPKLSKEPINGLPGIKDGSDVERSVYHVLDEIPSHESMLELLLKYDVVGQPTKEELKEAYEECYEEKIYEMKFYENYEYNRKRLEKIAISQGEKPKKVDPVIFNFIKNMRLNHYDKYCSDENSTFKDVRSFFAWANDNRKIADIVRFLKKDDNNPNKVIYIDQNSTIKNNQISNKN